MKSIVIVVTFFFLISEANATDKENKSFSGNDPKEAEYFFDPNLFRGSAFNQSSLVRLIKYNNILPGRYQLDVYTNNRYTGNYDILFAEQADGSVQPCLYPSLLQDAGLNIDAALRALMKSNKACLLTEQVVKGGHSQTDIAQLRLNLTIPANRMNNRPQGYIEPEKLDYGSALGFVNYLSNFYHASYSRNEVSNLDSMWMSFNGGINFGSWQYRQLSSLNWSRNSGNKWNNLRRFLQRPLPAIGSQFSFGELITNGRLFSGINYNGLSLSTDERMLPDTMRGYAPVIRGMASTNARVSVVQNGREIYQTTVAPGSFEINDLYPTSYSGDLEVTVTEANGAVSKFIVPFSAVPESMRSGLSRYSLELGKIRGSGNAASFVDLIWQRGISNSVTVNQGLRVADRYHAVVLGGVYGSFLGATGLDLTYSRARLPTQEYRNGWMAHLSWSKNFQPTNTTVTLAGYRYSSRGYRDLSDVADERERIGQGGEWQSVNNRQQSRFDLSLSQSLSEYGSLFLSGSVQNYRQGGSRTTQLQAGYSQSFRHGISMNLSLSRQYPGHNNNYDAMETMTSVSFSFPLAGVSASDMNMAWSHSDQGGSQYQTSVSGMMGTDQSANYSLNVMRDQKYRQMTIGGNLQKRLSVTTLGVNASKGKNYWQASGNLQGALAVHAGGVTPGPYLGDTFALVEAKGATGAKVFNSQQITIDNQGYALLPSVTPYRYNRITLDPEGMEGDAELLDSERRIAPVAGAGVKVVFRTRKGTALLITSRFTDGSLVPPGAEVLDEQGRVAGMAGQGGQIYLRTDKQRGVLTVRWGDAATARCRLPYNIPDMKKATSLIKLTSVCSS